MTVVFAESVTLRCFSEFTTYTSVKESNESI